MRAAGLITLLLLPVLLISCARPEPPTINLYRAVHAGNLDQIKRHIEYGTDLNQTDPEGRTALHFAAESGRMIISELLVKNGAQMDIRDSEGRTPLETALLSGKTKVADLLLEQGAQMDPQEQMFKAIRAGADFRELFRFFANRGADMNAPDDSGQTPLLAAVQTGNRVLVKRLIDQGANVDLAGEDGTTPLALANRKNHDDIVRLLKQFGATESP